MASNLDGGAFDRSHESQTLANEPNKSLDASSRGKDSTARSNQPPPLAPAQLSRTSPPAQPPAFIDTTPLPPAGRTPPPLRLTKLPTEVRVRDTRAKIVPVKDENRKQFAAPPWLVSMIVHVSALLILALIPTATYLKLPISIFLGQGSDVGIAEFELSGGSTEMLEVSSDLAEVRFDPIPVSKGSIDFTIPELQSFTSELENGLSDIPIGISAGLSGRMGQTKDQLLKRFGGGKVTEDAVELGLAWLAKNQKSDGSWSLVGPYSDGAVAENSTAATALAINAFLGAGYTHREGKYASEVNLGLQYLVRRQDEEGFFARKEKSRQQMYAQALATISVLEAFGMTRDYELQAPCQKAIRFAEWSQGPSNGWRYEPREDADLSVTGWYVMALKTAQMAGLKVDEKVLRNVNLFLDTVAHDDNTTYSYVDFDKPSLSMTAEGLLCRIFLGWPKSHPALLQGVRQHLLKALPDAEAKDTSVYYWYYATQVLHHVGGDSWKEWNSAMKRAFLQLQTRSGKEAGSWSPDNDAYGSAGGRLYTTCLCLYSLEVYYRHLSIYDHGLASMP